MSSNTPIMDSTDDNSQEKIMAKNKVPSENRSGYDSTITDKIERNKNKNI